MLDLQRALHADPATSGGRGTFGSDNLDLRDIAGKVSLKNHASFFFSPRPLEFFIPHTLFRLVSAELANRVRLSVCRTRINLLTSSNDRSKNATRVSTTSRQTESISTWHRPLKPEAWTARRRTT